MKQNKIHKPEDEKKKKLQTNKQWENKISPSLLIERMCC